MCFLRYIFSSSSDLGLNVPLTNKLSSKWVNPMSMIKRRSADTKLHVTSASPEPSSKMDNNEIILKLVPLFAILVSISIFLYGENVKLSSTNLAYQTINSLSSQLNEKFAEQNALSTKKFQAIDDKFEKQAKTIDDKFEKQAKSLDDIKDVKTGVFAIFSTLSFAATISALAPYFKNETKPV